MEKMYDVYGIGNALVDVVFQVSEAFLEKYGVKKGVMTLVDEETQHRLIDAINQDETTQDPGGSAANTMMAVSQLGGRSFYSCKVADDAFGQSYLNDMRQAGIATNFDEQKLSEGVTGKCLVMITDDAERTMNSYLGISATLSSDQVDEQAIRTSNYVYIEGYLVTGGSSFEAVKKVKNCAEENDVKTALTLSDPSIVETFKPKFNKLMQTPIDLLFCNEKEAAIYTSLDDISEVCEALKKSARKFIITRGAEGALDYDGAAIIHIQPQKVKAIDTNGAGDIFGGAFLYGITHGMTFEKAGKLANRAGAKVVSQYGPRLHKNEMKELLAAFS
jgi:sugar/nucleoside kinase (ribokinase family)